MSKADKNHDWEKWSVEKGDYHRDYHSTSRFEKNIRRKREIKNGIIVTALLIVLTIITYFVFK